MRAPDRPSRPAWLALLEADAPDVVACWSVADDLMHLEQLHRLARGG